MKNNFSLLNFILGIILLLLLAVAARAQNNNHTQGSSKEKVSAPESKQLTAAEARILYEKKFGTVNDLKRKAYSKKDIADMLPGTTAKEITYVERGKKVEDSANLTSYLPLPSQSFVRAPKAIYKGPQNTLRDTISDDFRKPATPLPVFLNHIEVKINPGGD